MKMKNKFMQKSPEYQENCPQGKMDCTNYESTITGDHYI